MSGPLPGPATHRMRKVSIRGCVPARPLTAIVSMPLAVATAVRRNERRAWVWVWALVWALKGVLLTLP